MSLACRCVKKEFCTALSKPQPQNNFIFIIRYSNVNDGPKSHFNLGNIE